jgi:hypothetical protein
MTLDPSRWVAPRRRNEVAVSASVRMTLDELGTLTLRLLELVAVSASVRMTLDPEAQPGNKYSILCRSLCEREGDARPPPYRVYEWIVAVSASVRMTLDLCAFFSMPSR